MTDRTFYRVCMALGLTMLAIILACMTALVVHATITTITGRS
jgi:hypothetical protein